MKKILLFSVIVASFCAFAAVNYKKAAPKVVSPEVVLSEPPPMEEYINQEEWEEYGDVYGKEAKDVKTDGTFEELLKLFPKGTLPYSLPANVLQEQFTTMRGQNNNNKSGELKRNIMPREFRKYFPALDNTKSFSRMPPAIGEPFLAFEAQGKHILVYFTRRGGYDYRVATFTKKGKLITETHFAHSGFYDINEAALDENLNLVCNSYSVLWDKQPDANGYKNCNITGLKLQRKTVESLLKEDSQKDIPLEKEVVQKAKP